MSKVYYASSKKHPSHFTKRSEATLSENLIPHLILDWPTTIDGVRYNVYRAPTQKGWRFIFEEVTSDIPEKSPEPKVPKSRKTGGKRAGGGPNFSFTRLFKSIRSRVFPESYR